MQCKDSHNSKAIFEPGPEVSKQAFGQLKCYTGSHIMTIISVYNFILVESNPRAS